jgi:hypothetical protein
MTSGDATLAEPAPRGHIYAALTPYSPLPHPGLIIITRLRCLEHSLLYFGTILLRTLGK